MKDKRIFKLLEILKEKILPTKTFLNLFAVQFLVLSMAIGVFVFQSQDQQNLKSAAMISRETRAIGENIDNFVDQIHTNLLDLSDAEMEEFRNTREVEGTVNKGVLSKYGFLSLSYMQLGQKGQWESLWSRWEREVNLNFDDLKEAFLRIPLDTSMEAQISFFPVQVKSNKWIAAFFSRPLSEGEQKIQGVLLAFMPQETFLEFSAPFLGTKEALYLISYGKYALTHPQYEYLLGRLGGSNPLVKELSERGEHDSNFRYEYEGKSFLAFHQKSALSPLQAVLTFQQESWWSGFSSWLKSIFLISLFGSFILLFVISKAPAVVRSSLLSDVAEEGIPLNHLSETQVPSVNEPKGSPVIVQPHYQIEDEISLLKVLIGKIKQPLLSVVAHAQLLRVDVEDPKRIENLADKIIREATRVHQSFDRMKEIIGAEQFILSPLSLDSFVEESLSELSSVFSAKSVQIKYTPSEVYVVSSATQLSQIIHFFLNFLCDHWGDQIDRQLTIGMSSEKKDFVTIKIESNAHSGFPVGRICSTQDALGVFEEAFAFEFLHIFKLLEGLKAQLNLEIFTKALNIELKFPSASKEAYAANQEALISQKTLSKRADKPNDLKWIEQQNVSQVLEDLTAPENLEVNDQAEDEDILFLLEDDLGEGGSDGFEKSMMTIESRPFNNDEVVIRKPKMKA